MRPAASRKHVGHLHPRMLPSVDGASSTTDAPKLGGAGRFPQRRAWLEAAKLRVEQQALSRT